MTNEVRNGSLSVESRHSFVIRYSDFDIKKVPPPTSDGREGRLFPPEHSSKTGLLVTELRGGGNKILVNFGEANNSIAQGYRSKPAPKQGVVRRDSSRLSLRKRVPRFLVFVCVIRTATKQRAWPGRC